MVGLASSIRWGFVVEDTRCMRVFVCVCVFVFVCPSVEEVCGDRWSLKSMEVLRVRCSGCSFRL